MTATVEVIAMKFGIMTHYNPLKPTHDQNFDFFLHSKMADGRRFEQVAQLSLRDRATRACQLKSGKVLHKCRRLVFEKL